MSRLRTKKCFCGFFPKGVRPICVVNKIDDPLHEERSNDFYSLGLEQVIGVSAEHNRGIDELRDTVVELLSEESILPTPEADQRPKIAIVGRPNVGKSTLVNAILGEDRMITSSVAGTTVDSVDLPAQMGDFPVILMDTAGIRRKGKTEQGVEVLSVVQTRKALERCDVAILVLDAVAGVTDQDEKIGGLIEEAGCGVILLVNKWDLLKGKGTVARTEAGEIIRSKMAYLKYSPIVFASAIRAEGLDDLGDLVDEILRQRKVKILTKEFTEWVREESEVHNPMNAKFYMCHQAGKNPPTFVCHVSDPKKIDFSLRRHLINGVRARWGYMGNPIRMVFVKGRNATK